jgi:hypothetical protein
MRYGPPAELAEQWWQAIEPTLPAGADRGFAHKRIEEIRASVVDKTSPQRLRKQCQEAAKHYDQAIRALRKIKNDQAPAEIERITHLSAVEKERGEVYRQIAKVRRAHFLQQCELVWLWQSLGGDLSITTPDKGALDPRGAVIPFFQAASRAVFDKSPAAFRIRNLVQRDFRRLNEHHLTVTIGLRADTEVIKAKT